MTDTLFAPATALGRAGIAVIRISGPGAKNALKALGIPLPAPRMATLADIGGIDRGLVLFFPAPASFTGEDMAELHVHGSRAVIKALCEALSAQGLRLAEPGEFARRAFMNGKMDLAEVEGLADLIDAEAESQRKQALRIVQGEASREYERLRARTAAALATLEATIDFSDEDIPKTLGERVRRDVESLVADIAKLLDDAHRGERIREGISIVILGAPNAGKSSLLNALAKRDAAIVSHMAGTTRDPIEVHLELAGYACALVDTAGLRDSTDPIEQEGIRRARHRAESADIKLLLFDATQKPDAATLALEDEKSIRVTSKADLATGALPGLAVSTHDPAGIAALLKALEARLHALMDHGAASPLITRARHREALTHAQGHLQKFLISSPVEIRCEHLRLAADCIGKITGKISVDELLGKIFSEFCIGK